jgi:phosphoribosylformylglycinamidine synthase
MLAKIHITLKNGVLAPQGKATKNALGNLGFEGVESVRQGKYIELEIDENTEEKAEIKVKNICEKLLVNSVIENYSFKLVA